LGKLSDAKVLGGIGSILEIIPILSIVGYILVLFSVKFVSDEVKDGSIFNDMIIAVVAGIVGVAAGGFILIFSGIFSIFTAGLSAFVGIIAVLVVVWIALIVSSIFVRRAYDKMATKLNVGTFRTAGTLYFIGALLTIILVGFLILFVAYIVQIVAFFSIQDTLAAPAGPSMAQGTSAMSPTSPPVAQGSTKYCSSCGAQIQSSATFCPKCGAKQP
jgi:uncharacterized membrane protein